MTRRRRLAQKLQRGGLGACESPDNSGSADVSDCPLNSCLPPTMTTAVVLCRSSRLLPHYPRHGMYGMYMMFQ